MFESRSMEDLEAAARSLVDLLAARNRQIVFAESCTCGLAAAAMGRVPGVSDWFCGSAVTYQTATKSAWLEVSAKTLRHAGPVSATTARSMAAGILEQTPDADIAVSITGHLGPGAPAELDGHGFIGTAARGVEPAARAVCFDKNQTETSRSARQFLAAETLLRAAFEFADSL